MNPDPIQFRIRNTEITKKYENLTVSVMKQCWKTLDVGYTSVRVDITFAIHGSVICGLPIWIYEPSNQGVTKRCCLSWLTNSALVYEPKRGGRGELQGLSQ
jgi:hypothetical protein